MTLAVLVPVLLVALGVAAAQKIYGPDAYWFMGLQDTIDHCKAQGASCSIYVGNPPNTGK